MFGRGTRKPARGRNAATFSFIGPEVTVTGDVATTGQLHVDGAVAGDIACGSLSQGESGRVRGNVTAKEVRLAGVVDGAVEAETVALEPTARVTGDVLYGSLSIAAGAEVEGRFKRLRVGEGGSAEARAEAAAGSSAPPVMQLFSEPQTAEAAE